MAEGAALNVMMVSASFHPYVGGAEKQALELSTALVARGLRVRVATRAVTGLPPRDEVRGVPVARLWCLGSGALNAATFMVSLFLHLLREAREYDVIHVHLGGSPALAAAIAGRLLGKRVIVKLGGGRGIGELASSAKTFAGRLKLRLLAMARPSFVAVARELADEAASYLGDVPVEVLFNGVDIERYRPASAVDRRALRARFGWPEGLGFLYVGRLSPEKRLPLFLKAWAEVVGEFPAQAFAAFVGEGPEKEILEETARSGPLRDRIFFHPPREDIWTAYAAADVFVLPSLSEGLSNALLEAMASGLAALASRVGGTVEAVEEGRSGLLFEAGDVDGLKGFIRRLLERPQLAAELGRAARETAVERYSLERAAQLWEGLYRPPPARARAPRP